MLPDPLHPAGFFGLGLAYGRFVTDNVEVGSSFSLLILSADGDIVAPGATPFLRLLMSVSEKTGLYFAGGLGLQYVSMDGGSATVLTPGVDAGLESFPVPSWSLRIGPSYRYMHASLSADGSSTSVTMKDHAIGLN